MRAQEQQASVSSVIREALEQVLEAEEEERQKKMYAALERLRGIGKAGVTDASTTIDELLYGENGAWRGSDYEDETTNPSG
jgi:Arc/MetJ-type ribon-helix-helix transcriptional regulator